jgi:hypothetical protein
VHLLDSLLGEPKDDSLRLKIDFDVFSVSNSWLRRSKCCLGNGVRIGLKFPLAFIMNGRGSRGFVLSGDFFLLSSKFRC